MVKTVRKNSKNLPAILANAIYLNVYTLSNNFIGFDLVADNVGEAVKTIMKENPECRFTMDDRMKDNGEYRYTIHIHSNRWYTFLSSCKP